ncbi:dihydroflavonol-4-reductase [Alicyclobacillus acidoterrestris]|uniref:hopanoid-associated sugar epimerase n=1 Tax=Alicyclobacillus suci TaxID=2816080 RepID=UPI00119200EB|nr:hopanoid-associated sugar epimerase [Alicyclobacillus suci]GEO25966.1 dihydroflavonol-4-reductase [Alicyclobacillus acidoterrestris]
MRALVTGATGFVGYHVAVALRSSGHSVRALVRSPEQHADRLGAQGIEVAVGDLATGQGLEAAVAGCDAVFHVAAHYSLDRRDTAIMHAVNVEGTKRVLDAVRKAGGPRLVYTSSTAAVGLRDDGKPADESRFVNPDKVHSVYKKTKVLAESLVLDAARGGMDIVIVNPSTPVGPWDVKPTPTGRIVLDTMLGKMPGYVETGLNLVAVEDVAAGHLLAYEKGARGERYILGNQNMHFGDLVATVARLSGRKPPSLKIPFWFAYLVAGIDEYMLSPLLAKSPRAPVAGVKLAKVPMYFTAEKAVRELGLPQTPVEDALMRAIEWFRAEGVKPQQHTLASRKESSEKGV